MVNNIYWYDETSQGSHCITEAWWLWHLLRLILGTIPQAVFPRPKARFIWVALIQAEIKIYLYNNNFQWLLQFVRLNNKWLL